MDKFYTYIYYDPSRNNEPIYVGKGQNKRAWEHLTSRRKHPFIQRLEFMKSNNIDPVIGFYSGLDEELSLLVEEELISKFGRKDLRQGPLLNLTDGGELGANKSIETRKKMSENNLGKKLSETTKKKMSLSRIGFKPSKDTKLKISEGQKGRIGGMYGKSHSEESKKKSAISNSETHKGKKRVYNADGTWTFSFKGKN